MHAIATRWRVPLITTAAWCCLLLLAWIAYRPGLSGGFLFDDLVNLPALGATGPVDDLATLLRYLSSGTADPTGRPIALLSFLLDARDWPAPPYPFLRTNLVLHLVNATLLWLLLRRLGSAMRYPEAGAHAAALFAAGIWLLHPLLVSTTLYVVQREAMLPGTFILLGLLAYCHGRMLHASTDGARGLGWMISGLVLGTALATLAKANGILLPLLAWVLEATVLRAGAAPLSPIPARRWVWTRRILVVLPSVVVLAYLALRLPHLNEEIAGRPWTMAQRLLTQPRVLLDYLYLLVAPRSFSTGLFNDAYLVSTNLWSPPGTLPAAAAIALLAGLGFHLRTRLPALSAAILFFFAAHLLESTVIPLELYFEHRNYVPAMLLFWPLGLALFLGTRPSMAARVLVAVSLLALCSWTTWQRATTWGQPARLSEIWALRNPDSSRAQAVAAMSEMNQGKPELALARLGPLWRQQPHDLQVALNYVNAACMFRGISVDETARIADALRHADKGSLLVREWLERALDIAGAGSCPGLDVDTVERWIDSALANPRLTTPAVRARSMPALLAMLALERREPDAALAQFDLALAANPLPDVATGQAALLAEAGYYRHALRHLDAFERLRAQAPRPGLEMARLHEAILRRQGYWPRELAILRGKLQREIANERTPTD